MCDVKVQCVMWESDLCGCIFCIFVSDVWLGLLLLMVLDCLEWGEMDGGIIDARLG
jgi:hypothetical protein